MVSCNKESIPLHSRYLTIPWKYSSFVRCSRSMKFKPVIFPELLKFSHVFSTKRFWDYLNRKEKIFPIVFPMIFHIQPSTKNNRMDMRMKIHGTSPYMEDTDIADISRTNTQWEGLNFFETESYTCQFCLWFHEHELSCWYGKCHHPRQSSAPFYIRTLLQTDSDCEFQETFLPDVWQ